MSECQCERGEGIKDVVSRAIFRLSFFPGRAFVITSRSVFMNHNSVASRTSMLLLFELPLTSFITVVMKNMSRWHYSLLLSPSLTLGFMIPVFSSLHQVIDNFRRRRHYCRRRNAVHFVSTL